MDAGTPRESAKPRNQRIPLGYLRRGECADPRAARRWQLSLLAGLLAAAAAAYVALPGAGGVRLANHGPVIDAHAGFEQDCAACHQPEQAKFDAPDASKRPPHFHAADAACAQCHFAPAHFAHGNLDGKEASCFSCHHDHAGRTVDLNRPPDANCTACHADPEAWRDSTKIAMKDISKATAFSAGGHPPFAMPKAKEQTLKFNHALHLKAGLKVGFAHGKLDARKLPEGHRLGKGQDPAALVQLKCDDCHERGVNASGSDLKPIVYEQHCAACHPLSAPGITVAKVELPHAVQGKALRELLMGAYAKQTLEGNPTLRQQLARDPKLAGAFAGRPELKAEHDQLEERVSAALGKLKGNQACGECHAFAKPPSCEVLVEKPNVPERWWRKARFSHAAHSSDCASCHVTKERAKPEASDAATDILMPTFQSCLQCHDAAKPSGARADCVLCHGYHGVALPKGADRDHHLTPRGGEVRR